MSEFDIEKIKKRLEVIQRERTLLSDFKDLSCNEFVAEENITKYYATLHHIQVALQAVLDTAQYIVAHRVLGDYKENKEVFKILMEKKILSKKSAKSFEEAIGLRNILVHQYEDVNPKIVYEIIQTKLSDLDLFVKEIAKYLETIK